MSLAAGVHAVQLNTVPLVVTVEAGLRVLRLPLAAEGRRDVPAGPLLAEEHLVQLGALVVLGAVPRLLGHLLKPRAGGVGEVATLLPPHVRPVLPDADVQVVTAAPALGEAPLSTARAPAEKLLLNVKNLFLYCDLRNQNSTSK